VGNGIIQTGKRRDDAIDVTQPEQSGAVVNQEQSAAAFLEPTIRIQKGRNKDRPEGLHRGKIDDEATD